MFYIKHSYSIIYQCKLYFTDFTSDNIFYNNTLFWYLTLEASFWGFVNLQNVIKN